MSSLLLLVLAACNAADPGAPSADPPSTAHPSSPSSPTEPTDPQTVDTAGIPLAVDEVSLGRIDASALALQITGVSLSCTDGEATARAEFLGPVGAVELAAWVDGQAQGPVEMQVEPGSLFRMASASGLPCGATWVVTVRADGQEACAAKGPEATRAASGACAPR